MRCSINLANFNFSTKITSNDKIYLNKIRPSSDNDDDDEETSD